MGSNFGASEVHPIMVIKRLALGTAQFGMAYGIANRSGQISRSAAKTMLRLAKANGIDTLDTAIDYGESEACLGEVGTSGFRVVTKLPKVPEDCADISLWVHEQINASLARLGVNVVYGLLLHRPEQLLEPAGEALYQALQDLKESGRVQKVGISIYAPNELDALIKRYRFDLVQAPFSLVDRRLHATGWLKRLKDEHIEVHTRSVFLQGLLLMSRKDIPQKFSPWTELWNRWHEWLSLRNTSPLQTCLAFPLSYQEIDRVIVGADTATQLGQIIISSQEEMTPDFPDIHCDEGNLINPSRWSRL